MNHFWAVIPARNAWKGWTLTKATIRHHVEEYLSYLEVMGRTKATVDYHYYALKRFAKWSKAQGVLHTEDVDKKHIRAYWRFLIDNYKGVNSAARSVRAFFNWLEAEGETGGNPVREAGFPNKPQEAIEPLSAEEVNALIEGAKKGRNWRRDSTLILWLYDTGMRVSEAASVRVRDVDFQGGQVTIRRKMHKTGTVHFSYRTSRSLKAYLRYERVQYQDVEALFTSQEGMSLDRFTIHSILRRAAERAGIPKERATPHKLRHSFAIAFLRNGGSALHLQALLGHSTLDMTKRYVNFSGRDFQEAHRKYSPVAHMKKARQDDDDW